jgi:predicted nucleic acid-binding protein
MASLLERLLRERKLSTAQKDTIVEEFLEDLQSMEICPVIDQVVVAATRVVEAVPTKTLDAVQIGCAIVSQPDTFVSADVKQVKAAQVMGLVVVRV